ncbi:MAG TPA: neutral zinc metallopeptidase [Vicinamibacterales bacterium]|nr:neutral zinc metallopeptidase [Vicinamibacterales bacterium]
MELEPRDDAPRGGPPSVTTLSRNVGGRVMPDRFTHRSSAQRVEWFRRGFDSGDPNVCNTFR